MRGILKNKWVTAGSLTFGCMLIVYFIAVVGLLENMELKSIDLRFRLRGELPIDNSDIVIVAIDDQSFVSLQRKWPFPRGYYAKAIHNLSEAGAKLIIFDIEFTEPSLVDELEDIALAEATALGTTVIYAGKIVLEYRGNDILNRYTVKPLKMLLDAGARWAYANIGHDSDGFIRRYSLFLNVSGQIHFPLCAEALRTLQQLSPADVISDRNNYAIFGDHRIPIYSSNSMLINYYGPAGHFPTYSFANILDDVSFDLPDDEDTNIFEIHKLSGTFKDKIVMIGASAEELQDNKFTPFFYYHSVKRKTPGVEIHANALNTMLNNDYIYRMNGAAQLMVVLALAAAAMFFARFFKPYIGLMSSAAVMVIYIIFCQVLFSQMKILISFFIPLLGFILSYGVNTVHRVLTEQQEKGFYRKTFQHYISKSVVDTMLNSHELPKFGGERKTLTVLFSDIRSFSSFSEDHSPELVVEQLSQYLSAMVEVIFRHQGTLDKFVGDEIMALFGAPYYYENHAERACRTALDMVCELRKLQHNWTQESKDIFQIGIGINTGKMIVGNLGSAQLFDYTVIGDEVNLGARLEGANKFYSTTIIIGESTYLQIKDKAVARELDYVCVKGKKKPVRIYELMGMLDFPMNSELVISQKFSRALDEFKKRRWYVALKLFRNVLRDYPNDGPAKLYTQRCLDFIKNPPPDDWNGMFEFTSK